MLRITARGRWLGLLATLVVSACAFDIIHVEQVPATVRIASPRPPAFVIERDVPVVLPFGYRRVLKSGTTWRYFGSIAPGDVFMTSDQVLTVEASNIHEAYIVVSEGRLVGFFLPVERTFSPVRDVTTLPMRLAGSRG